MNYNLTTENITENYGENLLKQRGIENVDLFLNPQPCSLQDWKDLDNIESGIQLIKDTINNNLPYALIVDCDVDGFTSSTILYNYIKFLNPNKKIEYFLHKGKRHGLEDMWEKLQKKEYCAILVPDAGSNDSQYAINLNVPILVLDHHILEDNYLANNLILINNQISEKYVNKNLSGAGVTWQFCRALDEVFNINYSKELIDLAALGIDADMMSMLSYENQYIIQTGFKNINNFFFKVLIDKQSYSMNNKITPITVAFYIVPMINAMIRVGSMDEKERLFLAFIDGEKLVPSNKRGAKGTMELVAIESARECTNAKSRQDKLKEKIVDSLDIKIHKNGLLNNQVLFIRLDDEDEFPPELNGLVAMQLSARYNKPTIVARLNNEGYIRGSARGLNKSELKSFKDFLNNTNLFEYTAGHDNAFGISINNSYLSQFHNIANKELMNIDFGINVYDVDFVRQAKDTDLDKIILDLSRYEQVWGQQNPEALILVKDIFIRKEDIQIIGKNKDTLKFEKNGITYIKFHAKDIIPLLNQYEEMRINLIGKGNLNEWGGRQIPQLFIEDLEVFDSAFDF